MIPGIEGVNYFLSIYRKFMTTKDCWCGITLNRDQAEQFIKECEMVEKHFKVLDIIKRKYVSIFQLSCCKNVNEYNDLKFIVSEKLTEEEFNLLKEVLK